MAPSKPGGRPPPGEGWAAANQRYLTAALDVVREVLERHAAPRDGGKRPAEPVARERLERAAAALPAPSALETLCQSFDLSAFERDVLLLAAGVELDASFARFLAAVQEDGGGRPTFGLALAALPEAHWSALTPGSPLRRWRLVEVGSGESLVRSPLAIDERILHYLTGLGYLDEHLEGYVEPVAPGAEALVPSHARLVEAVAGVWAGAGDRLPVVQLLGKDPGTIRRVAAAAAARVGLGLHAMPVHVLPSAPHDLDVLGRFWEREAMLGASALLVDGDAPAGVSGGDPATREERLGHFLESIGGAVLLAARERRRLRHRPVVSFEVGRPTVAEQRALWGEALDGASSDGLVDRLVGQFDLGDGAIRAAAHEARAAPNGPLLDRVWTACRAQVRPGLDGLARSLDPVATWDDIVLPAPQLETLREVASQVRQSSRVYESWGFASRFSRGLGISALFAGSSGTGKTMAAEVLANELALDLYHIDLSRVVSKYIGETEKNLGRIFDAAEEGGAILLFDEADALFGKRSEVKDSHDRYANIEVSYLLQRMEAYRGLAILTTNLKSAIDDAFLRRLRFVVQFPFPDAERRAEIWRRVFPGQTPTEGLDPEKLARLGVAGGHIKSIALRAAFLAADAGEPVRMGHLLRAARSELLKLDKPLSEGETRGWT